MARCTTSFENVLYSVVAVSTLLPSVLLSWCVSRQSAYVCMHPPSDVMCATYGACMTHNASLSAFCSCISRYAAAVGCVGAAPMADGASARGQAPATHVGYSLCMGIGSMLLYFLCPRSNLQSASESAGC